MLHRLWYIKLKDGAFGENFRITIIVNATPHINLDYKILLAGISNPSSSLWGLRKCLRNFCCNWHQSFETRAVISMLKEKVTFTTINVDRAGIYYLEYFSFTVETKIMLLNVYDGNISREVKTIDYFGSQWSSCYTGYDTWKLKDGAFGENFRITIIVNATPHINLDYKILLAGISNPSSSLWGLRKCLRNFCCNWHQSFETRAVISMLKEKITFTTINLDRSGIYYFEYFSFTVETKMML